MYPSPTGPQNNNQKFVSDFYSCFIHDFLSFHLIKWYEHATDLDERIWLVKLNKPRFSR